MTHIQQRRDPAATWTSVNPVLYDGEAGHESDTGKWKLGDGATAWNDLDYKAGVDSVAGKTGEVDLVVADVTGAAPLASPSLTGTPTAPTRATSDDSTKLATTAWVRNWAEEAPTLGNPVLTGTPTAPTPATADNDTSVATTAFVKAQFADTPLTGSPTAPTQSAGDNDTSVATTAFVQTAINSGPWTPYTPTWAGTGFILGNGVLSGAYHRIGNTVHFRARLIVGSETNITATSHSMTLPFPMADDTYPVFQGDAFDVSFGGSIQIRAVYRTASSVDLLVPSTDAGGYDRIFEAGIPFLVEPGDRISIFGTYECAP